MISPRSRLELRIQLGKKFRRGWYIMSTSYWQAIYLDVQCGAGMLDMISRSPSLSDIISIEATSRQFIWDVQCGAGRLHCILLVQLPATPLGTLEPVHSVTSLDSDASVDVGVLHTAANKIIGLFHRRVSPYSEVKEKK